MFVLRNIPIVVTPEEVLGKGKKRSNPAHVVKAAEEAITLAQSLWQPTAIYDVLDVVAIEGQDVLVSGPSRHATLHMGPHSDLLAPARQALVAVGTLGSQLQVRVDEIARSGPGLNALLLDNAGVMAVSAIARAVQEVAEQTAAAKGWGVGPSLAPGSLVGWSVEGQNALCSLLPLEQIGVSLKGLGVLDPLKSASWLVGIGPGYSEEHVGSTCYLCSLYDSCWRRKEKTWQ